MTGISESLWNNFEATIGLAQKNPSYYYHTAEFSYLRVNDKSVAITINFLLTQFRHRFEWYRSITFPLPVSSDSEHATLLMDMPILFAISQDRRFYVEFLAEDLILNLPNRDLRGLLVRRFKFNTHEVCSVALYEDNNATIKQFCRYYLIPHTSKPEIHVHNYPEFLLTNIGDFTDECERCRSCICVLESGCSLLRDYFHCRSKRKKFVSCKRKRSISIKPCHCQSNDGRSIA